MQTRFIRVSRFSGVDDGNLTAFGGFDKLAESAGVNVGDVSLFVGIVGEHLIVDLGAFVARGASGSFDVRLVRFGRSTRFHDDLDYL